MPIKLGNKIFESDATTSAFQKAVDYLVKKKGYSKSSAEAIVGSIEKKIKAATAAEQIPELYSINGKNYAKFFLINSLWNQMGWRVTQASIPENLSTFEGMPFISEDGLEHFGMKQDSDVSWILQEQDNYKAGTLIKTKYNPKTDTGEVVVEFDDTPRGKQVWDELNRGEHIYVSPAVTGIANFDEMNRITYDVWHGLHLARVKNPAYGVMAASIKSTCTGPRSACINRMMSMAASKGKIQSSSFNTENNSSAMAEADKIKELEETIGKLTSQVASVTSEKESLSKTIKDLEDKIKSASASGIDDATKEIIKTLQNQVAAAENEKKEEYAVALADGEVDAELLAKTKHQDRVSELMKMDLANIKMVYEQKKPLLEKIITLKNGTNSSFSGNKNRIISIPEISGASSGASIPDDKKDYSVDSLEALF